MDSNGEFSSNIVQEIAALLIDQRVPERYIHKNGYTPAEEAITGYIEIDFSRLSDEDELGKLRSALSEWGCFQVTVFLSSYYFIFFLIKIRFSFKRLLLHFLKSPLLKSLEFRADCQLWSGGGVVGEGSGSFQTILRASVGREEEMAWRGGNVQWIWKRWRFVGKSASELERSIVS